MSLTSCKECLLSTYSLICWGLLQIVVSWIHTWRSRKSQTLNYQLFTEHLLVHSFSVQMMALFGRKLQYILSSVNCMKKGVRINQTSLREFEVYWRTYPMILHVIAAHHTSAWRSQLGPSCTACWFLECWYILFMFPLHISDASSKKNTNIGLWNPQTIDFCSHLQYQFLASQSEGKSSFMIVTLYSNNFKSSVAVWAETSDTPFWLVKRHKVLWGANC